MKNWPNQDRMFDGSVDAISRGVKRLCVTSPTGSGKSKAMVDMINWAVEKGEPVALYTQRKLLYDQTCAVLDKAGIDYGRRASGHAKALLRNVQICMTPSELAQVYKAKSRELHQASLVLVDECFSGDTEILTVSGKRRIDKVAPGDIIYCAAGTGVVTCVTNRPETILYHLEFSDGSQLKCTENHPLFTTNGWVAAKSLVNGAITYSPKDLSDLWEGISTTPMDKHKRKTICNSRVILGSAEHLLSVLLQEISEPNGDAICSTKGKQYLKKDRTQTYLAWRERAIASLATACITSRSRRRLGSGVCSCDRSTKRHERPANLLQSGHSSSTEKNSNRDRRALSSNTISTRTGCKKDDNTSRVRLVSISRIERKSPVPVYNLQVSRHPSYFANGKLVHNCHVQTGGAMQQIMTDHVEAGANIIGYTATPLDLDGLYDELLVAGSVSECRGYGALVAAETYAPDEPDLRFVRNIKIGEDLTTRQNAKAIMVKGIFGRVIESWKKHNPEGKPTLLFAPGVKESIWFAEQLTAAGIRTAHIDGNDTWLDGEFYPSNPESRQLVIDLLQSGDIKVLSNRFVLREGIDLPFVGCGIFATVFGALTSYMQSGGRLLRACPRVGKEKAIIIDHGGNWHRHGSLNADRIWTLGLTNYRAVAERQEALKEKKDDKVQEPIVCPECARVRNGGRQCPYCGFVAHTKSRIVVQENGNLIKVDGDIYKAKKTKEKNDTAHIWSQCYCRMFHSDRSFRQGEALFCLENHYWPPKTLPMMPRDDDDWYRKVRDVPINRLIDPPVWLGPWVDKQKAKYAEKQQRLGYS